MHLCYIDESGDTGFHDPLNPQTTGSPYYLLCAFIVPEQRWKYTLDVFKSFRKYLSREYDFPYDEEFHCTEIIDTHKVKAFQKYSKDERWKLIDEAAVSIGQLADCHLIAVVINKSESKLEPQNYATEAMTNLYQAIDQLLMPEKWLGIIFIDRTNIKTLNTHIRKLLQTGSSGQASDVRITRIVEDPLFIDSKQSFFIQAADVCAFTLKEHLFPVGARKKFNAERIFPKRLQNILFDPSIPNKDGIVYL